MCIGKTKGNMLLVGDGKRKKQIVNETVVAALKNGHSVVFCCRPGELLAETVKVANDTSTKVVAISGLCDVPSISYGAKNRLTPQKITDLVIQAEAWDLTDVEYAVCNLLVGYMFCCLTELGLHEALQQTVQASLDAILCKMEQQSGDTGEMDAYIRFIKKNREDAVDAMWLQKKFSYDATGVLPDIRKLREEKTLFIVELQQGRLLNSLLMELILTELEVNKAGLFTEIVVPTECFLRENRQFIYRETDNFSMIIDTPTITTLQMMYGNRSLNALSGVKEIAFCGTQMDTSAQLESAIVHMGLREEKKSIVRHIQVLDEYELFLLCRRGKAESR